MNIRIEIRYGILISFLLLLWQIGEFEVGLHDKYIEYHSSLTLIAVIIPIVCGWFALKEKIIQLGGVMTFNQAFIAGFFISLFAAICSIPFLSVLYKFVDPQFFSNMIEYTVKHSVAVGIDVVQAREEAEMYFNYYAFLLQGFLGTLLFGTLLSVIMAWQMRTET